MMTEELYTVPPHVEKARTFNNDLYIAVNLHERVQQMTADMPVLTYMRDYMGVQFRHSFQESLFAHSPIQSADGKKTYFGLAVEFRVMDKEEVKKHNYRYLTASKGGNFFVVPMVRIRLYSGRNNYHIHVDEMLRDLVQRRNNKLSDAYLEANPVAAPF